jgi:hypothetical protein
VSIARRLSALAAASALATLALIVPTHSGDAADAATHVGPAGVPSVRADATWARVSAPFDAKGTTTIYYEYGTTTAYGSTTAPRTLRDVDPGRYVYATNISGLTPGTAYHVRLIFETGKSRLEGPSTRFVTGQPNATSAPAPEPSPEVPLPVPAPSVGEPAPAGEEQAPAAPPAPTAEAPAPADALTPAPVQGSAVVAAAVSGSVRVKSPRGAFVPLSSDASVPVGSVVDARGGTIALSSATNDGTQIGEFRGAVFQVRQNRHGGGMTELHLKRGDFTACRSGNRGTVHAAGKRKRVVRSLWGKDKGGRFRTRGRDSVATVRGTAWKVIDRCDGTVTRVTEGAVVVRDRHTGRRTLVRAGERHFARHR